MQIPRSMIEAGAWALCKKAHADNDVWDSIPEDCKRVYAFHSETAIRAAIGCAEVFCEHNSDVHPCAVHVILPGCGVVMDTIVHKGDTILIVRAEKGGGNG